MIKDTVRAHKQLPVKLTQQHQKMKEYRAHRLATQGANRGATGPRPLETSQIPRYQSSLAEAYGLEDMHVAGDHNSDLTVEQEFQAYAHGTLSHGSTNTLNFWQARNSIGEI
jgi:hypothetical protein